MAETYTNLGSYLTDVADAIRTKENSTAEIAAADIPDRILAIETGINTGDATATADDILSGKTAYGADGLLTGTIATSTTWNTTESMDSSTGKVTLDLSPSSSVYVPSDGDITASYQTETVTPTSPTVSITDAGLITANATYSNGYITNGDAGTKTATLDVGKSVVTINSIVFQNGLLRANFTFSHGYWNGTTSWILGNTTPESLDSNLVASNIKSGVTIFNTTGTYAGAIYFCDSDHIHSDVGTNAMFIGGSIYPDNSNSLICGTNSIVWCGTRYVGLYACYTYNSDTACIMYVINKTYGYRSLIGAYQFSGNYLAGVLIPDAFNYYIVGDYGTYGFSQSAITSATYTSTNNGVSNSAAVSMVEFCIVEACTATIEITSSGESSYDYAYVSTLNTALDTSNTVDDSSKILLNCYGQSGTTLTTTVDLPVGTSYIYIKYRKDASVDTSPDTASFSIKLSKVLVIDPL